MLVIAVTLVFGASVANAISSGCISTLTAIALSPSGDCLNIAGLVSLATLSSTSSIIPPIDSWLTGLCAETSPSKCSDSTLRDLGTQITNSCGSDLTNVGLPSSIVSQLPDLLPKYYPVGVEAFCSRDTSKSNQLCVTLELNILQNSVGGSLTTKNVVSSATGVLSNATLEGDLACTACVQGMYAVIRPQLSNSIQSTVESVLNSTCGNAFVTSTKPTQIVAPTGTLAPNSKSNAVSLAFMLPSVSMAVLVSAGACVLGSVLGGINTVMM